VAFCCLLIQEKPISLLLPSITGKMKLIKTIANNIFVRNLALAVIVAVVLVTATLWLLKLYTHHGEAVVVPDVKYLQIDDATPFFKKADLRFEVVDSIHVKNAEPGSIIEMTPTAGSKVKANRIIFITINSFSAKMFTIPEVKDLSQRQALAMLRSTGFENITVQTVSSPYKDLVIGLKHRGQEALSGKKLPANAPLVLLVSSGEYSEIADTISDIDIQMQEDPIQDNSWF